MLANGYRDIILTVLIPQYISFSQFSPIVHIAPRWTNKFTRILTIIVATEAAMLGSVNSWKKASYTIASVTEG